MRTGTIVLLAAMLAAGCAHLRHEPDQGESTSRETMASLIRELASNHGLKPRIGGPGHTLFVPGFAETSSEVDVVLQLFNELDALIATQAWVRITPVCATGPNPNAYWYVLRPR